MEEGLKGLTLIVQNQDNNGNTPAGESLQQAAQQPATAAAADQNSILPTNATPTPGEEDEEELEDVVWNFMEKTGFSAHLKSQILKFIEQNGKLAEISVIPERADPPLLQQVFDYLKWLGMTNTCAALAVESPVTLDIAAVESHSSEWRPSLCKIFADDKNANSEPPTAPPDVPSANKDEAPTPTALSSNAEDSPLISDISIDLNTEDVSLGSRVTGISSAEHQVNLK